VYDWPEAPKGGAHEVAVLCDNVRTYLLRAD
jgi:hypothetical protein